MSNRFCLAREARRRAIALGRKLELGPSTWLHRKVRDRTCPAAVIVLFRARSQRGREKEISTGCNQYAGRTTRVYGTTTERVEEYERGIWRENNNSGGGRREIHRSIRSFYTFEPAGVCSATLRFFYGRSVYVNFLLGARESHRAKVFQSPTLRD